MILYIETNFFLEVALVQEQSQAAGELLALAERDAVTLCYPTYSIGESFAAMQRRFNARQGVYQSVQIQTRELARSAPQQRLADEMLSLAVSLVAVNRQEANALDDALMRVIRAGRALELSRDEHDLSRAYVRNYDLDAPDAIILACIVADLALQPPDAPKIFVSRDLAAFANPLVRDELRLYGCEYLGSFEGSLGRIRHALQGP